MATKHLAICIVCEHRSKKCGGGSCLCSVDGIGVKVHAASEKCPKDKFANAPEFPTGDAHLMSEPWAVRGPRLWSELHARPKDFAGDVVAELAWLEKFAARIGCGECKRHWLAWVEKNPPDLATADTYYIWTARAHDVVNVRMGKPVWVPKIMAGCGATRSEPRRSLSAHPRTPLLP